MTQTKLHLQVTNNSFCTTSDNFQWSTQKSPVKNHTELIAHKFYERPALWSIQKTNVKATKEKYKIMHFHSHRLNDTIPQLPIFSIRNNFSCLHDQCPEDPQAARHVVWE